MKHQVIAISLTDLAELLREVNDALRTAAEIKDAIRAHNLAWQHRTYGDPDAIRYSMQRLLDKEYSQ
jgi:gamma-glutamyltranspeptidase